jgi:uncharacterized protein YraI
MNRSVALVVLVVVTQLLACQIAYLFPTTTPTPTRTRTRTPSPVALAPTPTVIVQVPTPPAPAEIAAVAQDNLRIRATPSTSAAIVGRLNKGDSVQVVGRTPASDWLRIALPTDPNQSGWISAEFATLSGPLDSIPIVQPGSSGAPTQPSRPPSQPSYPYP